MLVGKWVDGYVNRKVDLFQIIFSHHSEQMFQRSHVLRIALFIRVFSKEGGKGGRTYVGARWYWVVLGDIA